MSDHDVLRIEGLVSPGGFALDRAALSRLPGQVADVGVLVRGKQGRGVTLAALFAHAGAASEARHLLVESSDPSFAISVPLEEVRSGVVVYELEGGALPASKGGPFRLLVAGHPDECVHVKELACLRLAASPGRDTRPADDAAHRLLHAKAKAKSEQAGP